MTTKTLSNYQQALDELQNLAQEAFDLSDLDAWASIGNDADALKLWLDQGQQGPCPVDLDAYGIKVQSEEETPQAVEPPSAEPETEEGGEAKLQLEITSSDTGEDEAPQPHIETPEQARLRKQLEEAQEYFEQGQLREALALSAQIENRAEASDVKEAAADLRDRAQRELNTRLDNALADGDAARAAGDEEAARTQYRAAQELDSENAHARRALIELNGVVAGAGAQFSQAEAQRLRVGLKEKRDIKKLGEAVYQAEALDVEDKLSEELGNLLKAARQYYDDLRTRMGQETTMVRFGGLGEVKAAWLIARQRLADGYPYTYHSVLNKDVDTTEYVEETDRLLEEQSAETAQYESEIVARSLPAHPLVARQRLQRILTKPHSLKQLENILNRVYPLDHLEAQQQLLEDRIHSSPQQHLKKELEEELQEVTSLVARRKANRKKLLKGLKQPSMHPHHLRVMEEKLQEVEKIIGEQGKAEALLDQAGSSADPVEIFKLIQQAYSVFPHISELEKRLAQARQTAGDSLAAQMNARHREADVLLKTDTEEAYTKARAEIAKAGEIAARWPEAEQPSKLAKLLGAGKKLVKKINARQALRTEFEKRVEAIRQQISDPNRREAGRQQFQKLREDNRFAEFSEFGDLTLEMALGGQFSEQLSEAQAAKIRGEWNLVYKLAERMKTEGKAGQFAADVDALFDEAVLELDIVHAQQRLQNKDVFEANKILSYIIEKAPTKARREELEGRLKADLEHIKQCIANTGSMQKLFDQALGMVGLLGSPFAMAFLVHALDRSQSAEPISGLTQPDYEKIEKIVERKQDEPLSIQGAADGAKILLLDELKKKAADDRVRALRLFRYVQGDASGSPGEDWEPYRLSLRTTDAGKIARLLTESLRQDVLEPLQTAYGRREEKEFDESQLRILVERAHTLREAELLESESEREVARWFEVEQGRRAAVAKERLGDWDGAVAIWQEFDRRYPGEERIQESLPHALQKKKTIQSALDGAAESLRNGQRRNALQTLRSALGDEITKDEPALQARFDEIFKQAQTALLGLASKEGKKNDIASISRAVLTLHELAEIEAMQDQPEAERDSTRELKRLQKKLKKTQPDLADQLPKLADLYNLLQEAEALQIEPDPTGEAGGALSAGKETKWDEAVRGGNFSALENYWTQIEQLDFGDEPPPLALAYRDRLDEWQDVYSKLSRDILVAARKFEGDEAFDEVVKLLRGNTVLPPTRPAGKKPWLHVQQGYYEHIRSLMSSRMIVSDAYGQSSDNKIEGWGAVEQTAARRVVELDLWETWDAECTRLLDAAAAAVQAVQGLGDHLPLAHQQEAWEGVCEASLRAVDTLILGPRQGEQAVPLHSSKAKKIKQEGNRRLDVAQGWFNGALESLMKIIRQIGDLGGFPTPEDFKRAAERAGKRDCADLERLFARANTIGPGNSILSTGEFKFAAGRVSQGDLEPLRRLLRFTDLLGLRNYPASQDYENAVAKANDGDRQPLDGLLAQIDSGLAVQTVFKTAKDQAAQENFEQLKGFLHYSAQIHASRKKGEQDRLQIYSRVLEQCSAQKPSLFDWIRDLFGW